MFFKVICQISRSRETKKSLILTQIWRFRTVTPVWIHWWHEMMHKAWSSIKDVPYFFFRPSVKFQGHTGRKKWPTLTRIERFRTQVLIHRWFWNDAQILVWYRRGAPLLFEVMHQIWRSHGLKNQPFESNLSKITRPAAAIKSIDLPCF